MLINFESKPGICLDRTVIAGVFASESDPKAPGSDQKETGSAEESMSAATVEEEVFPDCANALGIPNFNVIGAPSDGSKLNLPPLNLPSSHV